MDKNKVINSLNQYINENPRLEYYEKCKKKVIETYNDDKITKIVRSARILESIRIHILSEINRYNIYLYNKRKENEAYLLLKLDDNILYKLLYQLKILTEYNDILKLGDNVEVPDLKLKKKDGVNYLYIVISEKELRFDSNYYQLKHINNCLGYLFGVDTMKLLQYQRLDRIKNFINKGGESFHLYDLLNNFLKILEGFGWKERERMLVFSGTMFQALGTTYTRDVDILIIRENDTKEQAKKLYSDFLELNKKGNMDADPYILANDGIWYGEYDLPYKSIWLTYQLPALVGAKDIFEVISNPKHFFHFMGIKFASIDMNIKKFVTRSNANSLTDLIMLNKINNINMGKLLCIPNMTVRQGRLEIFNKYYITKLYEKIREKLKEYYDVTMSVDEISSLVSKCICEGQNLDNEVTIKDPDTNIIREYILLVKKEIFKQFPKINYLLDIHNSKPFNRLFYENDNIQNIVLVNPAKNSLKYTKINNPTIVYDPDFDVWKDNNKYNDITKNKYDVILMDNTIQSMIKKNDILIQNIQSISHDNTKIIIICLDGNKIHNNFDKRGIIEIRNEKEPLFAVSAQYDFKNKKYIPDNTEILIYFKGAESVANGSIESLVNVEKLISKMQANNFKLISNKHFTDFDNHVKKHMTNVQVQIASYFTVLIFSK